MKSIFFVINEGFSSRYLLRSNLLNFSSKQYKIVILSPNAHEKYFINDFSGKNIFFELYENQKYIKTRFSKLMHYIRILSFKKKYKNKFSEYWSDKYFENKNIILKNILKAIIYLYSNIKFVRSFLNYLSLVTAPVKYQFLFKKYKPSAILVTSLGNLSNDCFIMYEARKSKCKIISLILSWDNTTTKGLKCLNPDYVVSWSKVMTKELINFHDINKNKIITHGSVQFEEYFKQKKYSKIFFKKKFNITNKNKILTLFLESPTSFSKNINLINILIKFNELNNFRYNIIIRPHPLAFRIENNKFKFYNEIKKYKTFEKKHTFLRINFPKIKSKILSYDMDTTETDNVATLIYHSDLVLCFYSTIMLEAAVFKKPTINLSIYERDVIPNKVLSKLNHNRRVLEYGVIEDVKSTTQLYSKISYLLKYKKPKKNLNELLRNELIQSSNASKLIFNSISKII